MVGEGHAGLATGFNTSGYEPRLKVDIDSVEEYISAMI